MENQKTISFDKAISFYGNSFIQCYQIVDIDENFIYPTSETDCGFYDYYLSDCNSNDVENLTKKFNQVYFGYSPLLDNFVLCVDHIGTAWNCYNINFKS